MTIKYKKIISILLVFIIALATGISVGRIYVDGLETAAIVGASESELRESDEKVQELVKKSKTSPVTSFSALELYLIAEYNLSVNDFYKIMTGTVYATAGVKQQMKGERLKKDGLLIYNKLSPSTSSFAPDVCSRVIYDYNNPDQIKVYNPGKAVFSQTEKGDLMGVFNESDMSIYSQEQYQETFHTLPTSVFPYIISSITTSQAEISDVAKTDDGNYKFSFKISGDLLAFAATFYSYEIKFSSKMADPPSWKSLTLTATVDSNFNFVQIEYNETYTMNAPIVGNAEVTDVFVEKIYVDNLPSVEYVLNGREAA